MREREIQRAERTLITNGVGPGAKKPANVCNKAPFIIRVTDDLAQSGVDKPVSARVCVRVGGGLPVCDTS